MKKTDSKQFIVIITGIVKGVSNSNAILFPSFEEALRYAQRDATYYKHLANEYKEQVGTNKLHARIRMKGKYIDKSYFIHDLGYDKDKEIMDTHLNTYSSWDYLPDGMCI